MIPTIFAATAAWHGLAAWHFGVTPARTLGRTTSERPVAVLPTELFRFLAGLNLALVVLGLWAAAASEPGARRMAAVVLAVANASQFAQDLRVDRLGLVRGPMFRTIWWGDLLFTVANVAVAVVV